jgi:hypothetical protein
VLGVVLDALLLVALRRLSLSRAPLPRFSRRNRPRRQRRVGATDCFVCEDQAIRAEAYLDLLLDPAHADVQTALGDPERALCFIHATMASARRPGDPAVANLIHPLSIQSRTPGMGRGSQPPGVSGGRKPQRSPAFGFVARGSELARWRFHQTQWDGLLAMTVSRPGHASRRGRTGNVDDR